VKGYGGTLILPTGPTLCVCDTRSIGFTVFHGHIAALATAKGMNRNAGLKKYRIVVVDKHFMVVDHTWERNT
jgi:hypothetical protein